MQIPVLSGLYTDENSEFRTAYPKNLIPVPKGNGISQGYLRPADGIISMGTGPGVDRGGISWNSACYRVMGSQLVRVASDGSTTSYGTIAGSGQCTLDYSFDHLGVCGGNNFYLFNGGVLTQVTDPDLGSVIDFIFIDGYWMTTDGTYLVVTELTDPFAVNPLKYGSSEVDPDPVKALLKYQGEAVALNRYSIESFQNIGGDYFPFQRIDGAMIPRGTVGTHSCCLFADAIAFVGGGRNEPPAVWLGSNGNSVKISTREIDLILSRYTEAQLSDVVCEARVDKSHQFLYIHLPNQTVVYDYSASQIVQEPVWFTLSSSVVGNAQYRAKNMVYCYDRWVVGDPQSSSIGYFVNDIASHWGSVIGWEFNTSIVYNESRGAIFDRLELVCLSGRAPLGADPTIYTSYSIDGETWSQERSIQAGRKGQRNKRLVWFQQGFMRNWRIQKFRGTSDSMLSIARLEAQLRALAA